MNRVTFLYVGVLLTVVASFIGLVGIPQLQLGGLEPVTHAGSPEPDRAAGAVAEGRELYRNLGCIYCHSQQVRPPGFGADQERGWGDFIYEAPHLFGTMRTGPDLANIGIRQPSKTWHMLHLYDPQLTSPGSLMPPHRFLFEIASREVERPYGAIDFPPSAGREGSYLIPRQEAETLIAYLASLRREYDVPEI
jgi:cytochrome c oxidase cbb3-type subunit II